MITVTDQSKKYIGSEREPASFTAEIFKCDKISLDKGKTFKIINSSGFSLLYVSKGQIMLDCHKLNNGDVLCLGRFTKTRIIGEHSAEFFYLTFSLSVEPRLFSGEPPIFYSKHEIAEYFEKLYSLRHLKEVLSGVKEAYLLLILNHLNTSLLFSTTEQQLFNTTYNYIENNIKQYLTPTSVADAMNCTVTHLNRIIRQHSGKSLGEFIAERRITEIKQLCRFGFSTNEIAEKLSFPTTELLRKYFRYHAGLSLKNYRIKKS